MLTSSSDKGSQAQRGKENESISIKNKPSSSRQYFSTFRNPRIVRVSRTQGGKDRHSKVYTIRGLRDRRIRLSVPTAIQLYDLQDRLGLAQPSKVIDWLIDATKDDIDKLPPLQFPQGFGSTTHQFFHHQQMFLSQSPHDSRISSSSSCFPPFLDPNPVFGGLHSLGIGINTRSLDHREESSLNSRSRNSKEVANFIDKGKWIMNKSPNEEENQEEIGNYSSLMNSSMPFNSYLHCNSSSLSLSSSQFGSSTYGSSSYSLIPQENSLRNGTVMSLMPPSSSLSLSSVSQLFFSNPPPSATTTTTTTTLVPQLFPPPFHPFVTNYPSIVESSSRDMINGFQFFSPSSQQVSTLLKPSPLNVNSGLVLLQHNNNESSNREHDDDFHS